MNRNTCRSYGSTNLKSVVSLGLSPLANNLLDSQDETAEMFPLEMMYCPESHNCQLSYVVPAEKMFNHYLYVSSTAKSFRDHFAEAADKYIREFNLNENSIYSDKNIIYYNNINSFFLFLFYYLIIYDTTYIIYNYCLFSRILFCCKIYRPCKKRRTN